VTARQSPSSTFTWARNTTTRSTTWSPHGGRAGEASPGASTSWASLTSSSACSAKGRSPRAQRRRRRPTWASIRPTPTRRPTRRFSLSFALFLNGLWWWRMALSLFSDANKEKIGDNQRHTCHTLRLLAHDLSQSAFVHARVPGSAIGSNRGARRPWTT